jgi:nucleotide-binding universal stress UspA family protein
VGPVIVVGLDSSAIASEVLARACALARYEGGELHVVRAVTVGLELPAEALPLVPADFERRVLEASQRALEHFVQPGGRDRVASMEARIGVPWQVICDVARERGATLIVIGAHAYKTLDRILGTTAAKVVNHAPCSVYVVRSPTHG